MAIIQESILDNKTLFYYIIIFAAITFAFSTIKVGLNIIYGTVIAALLVHFLYNNYKDKQDDENKTKSHQESLLLPKPEIIGKYEDIIKYLFSIQDIYVYNPQAYEEMVESLANFFRTYEETQNNPRESGRNYGLMTTYKRNSINAVHSIIHTISTDVKYTDKLNRAITTLGEILDRYMAKVERMQKEYLHDNGYNNQTKLINKGELAYNEFDQGHNERFSYDLF